MGGARNCLSSCQFHCSIYADVISALHFLPRQNSLCLRISLTTTLADALSLPRDCDCEPRLVGRGNLWKPVGPGRLGYHADVIAGSLPSIIARHDSAETISERDSSSTLGTGAAISLWAR